MFTSGYRYLPLEKAFADAVAFGYDYIELWGGRPHAFAPDLKSGGLGGLARLIEKYQMPVKVYTPEHNAYPYNYMLGSSAQRVDALNYLKLAMEMGAAMGADYTLVSVGHGSSYLSPQKLWDRLITSLSELAEYGEKLGHRLLLEPLTPFESNICTTAAELSLALEQVNSPCLLGMCDVVVPFVQGEPFLNYPRRLGARLRHLHLVDSDGKSDTHLLPGDGALPLGELIAQLREIGYDGTATLELVTAYLDDPPLYARLAVERVREFLRM